MQLLTLRQHPFPTPVRFSLEALLIKVVAQNSGLLEVRAYIRVTDTVGANREYCTVR